MPMLKNDPFPIKAKRLLAMPSLIVLFVLTSGGWWLVSGSTSGMLTSTAEAALSPRLYLPLVIGPTLDPFEAEVLDLVNQERAKAGCDPVTVNRSLRQAAYLHSKDMGDQIYFSHTGLDGSSFSQRARRAGYTGSPRGENIAAGYSSPTSVMNGWMNSTGHRNNILNCSSNEIGIGYYFAGQGYGHYWTQVFGRK